MLPAQITSAAKSASRAINPMPTVFSAKLDGSEAVRYFHVSLVTFYLREAHAHTLAAAKTIDADRHFAESMLAVVLSALCLESFCNELAENILPTADLDDFLMARRKYKRPPGLASVTAKILTIFESQWPKCLSIEDPLVKDVEALFAIRNALVHYRLGESATKAYLPPPAQIRSDTGTQMTVIDFMQRPTRIAQSLVERVNSDLASKAYDTALKVLSLWNQKAGAPPGASSAHQQNTPS
jgi:hypothetical protein